MVGSPPYQNLQNQCDARRHEGGNRFRRGFLAHLARLVTYPVGRLSDGAPLYAPRHCIARKLPDYLVVPKCLKLEISFAPQLRLSPSKAIILPLMR